MIILQKIKAKELILASAIALTLFANNSYASLEKQAELWLKTNHTELTKDNITAYYVRYSNKSTKNQVKDNLKSLGAKINYELEDYNTLAITLPNAKAKNINNFTNVVFYEPIPKHSTQAQVVPWNINQFQARDVWDKDRDGIIDPNAPDGSGVKFCIIDSGFYAVHDDFQGITHSGTSQIPGELYTEDGLGHGTHVSGTANAVNNNIGVVGVMPGAAELIIVKVFDNTGAWSVGNSNLGAAAIYCKDQGANVINMSLGGGSSITENNIFQDLYDNFNIISIAAAGNDGNATSSFPANYESVISVAALRESENVANLSQFPATSHNPLSPPANTEWDVVELSGGGENVLSTWPTPNGNVPVFQVSNDGTDYSANRMADTSLGDITATLVDGGLCETSGSWNGDIVLCERGNNTFAEKMNNAADGGAVAVVIFNNITGTLNGTCAGNCTTGAAIPGLSISQIDGQFLFANGLGLPTRVLADDGSGCIGCNGGYISNNGTSMASPGVAAGIALVWDACGGPAGITNKELRQLIRDSARDLSGVHDASGSSYGTGWDPHTGFGLVQSKDALNLGNQRFGSTCSMALAATPSEVSVCTSPTATDADFIVTLADSFAGTSNLMSTGTPAGATSSFTPNTVVFPANSSAFNVTNLDGIGFGNHVIALTATDGSDPSNTASTVVVLNTYSSVPENFNLLTPADLDADINPSPTFTWEASIQANTYTLEVAADAAFTNIVINESGISGNSYTPVNSLASDSTFYWRVKADNICGDNDSNIASFTTSNLVCFATPSSIPDSDANGVLATINIPDSGIIDTITVSADVSHTWVGDLTFSLEHAGTTVILMDRPGRIDTGVGCSEDNVITDFDDSSLNLVEDMCNNTSPAIGLVVAPEQALSGFIGLNQTGNWNLTVTDTQSIDTGTLNEWCVSITLEPPMDLIFLNGFE